MFVTVHEDKRVYILREQTQTFLIYDVSGATKYTLDRCTGLVAGMQNNLRTPISRAGY